MAKGVLTNVLVCCGAVPKGERADRYAKEAYHLGGLLALGGFRVVTTGDMGLVHEVCRGAKAGRGPVHTMTLCAAGFSTTTYRDTTVNFDDPLIRLRSMLAEAQSCVMFGPGMSTAYMLFTLMEHVGAGLVPPEMPVLLCKAFPDDFAEQVSALADAMPERTRGDHAPRMGVRIANTPLDAVDALLAHFAPPAPR